MNVNPNSSKPLLVYRTGFLGSVKTFSYISANFCWNSSTSVSGVFLGLSFLG